MTNRLFQLGGMAVGTFALGSGAMAAAPTPVTITNPSFHVFNQAGTTDLSPLSSGAYTRGLGATTLNPYTANTAVTVPGWTSADQGFGAGVENPGAAIAPNDTTLLYLNNGSATQALGGTVQAGTYVLTVDVGIRSDRGAGAYDTPLVQLLAGSTVLTPSTSVDPTPASGSFTTWTQTYVVQPGDSLINSTLGIKLQGTSNSGSRSTELDNVGLTFAAVPEPGVLGMLGVAGAIGAMRRRPRRR